MIEQVFKISLGNERTVEKVIADENLHYNHVILNEGEGLPEHYSNSNVYITVLRGVFSIGLNDQKIHDYDAGNIIKIPVSTKMNIQNLHDKVLEFIIVKSPAPKIG